MSSAHLLIFRSPRSLLLPPHLHSPAVARAQCGLLIVIQLSRNRLEQEPFIAPALSQAVAVANANSTQRGAGFEAAIDRVRTELGPLREVADGLPGIGGERCGVGWCGGTRKQEKPPGLSCRFSAFSVTDSLGWP